jgi:hypothetical protein
MQIDKCLEIHDRQNRLKRSDFHVCSVAAIDRKNGRRKQDVIWPHLCDAGGNLDATWYG